jgi:hypothetical protein
MAEQFVPSVGPPIPAAGAGAIVGFGLRGLEIEGPEEPVDGFLFPWNGNPPFDDEQPALVTTRIDLPMPRAGVLLNMFVRTSGDGNLEALLTYTTIKNGEDQSLTVQLAGDVAQGSNTDESQAVVFNQGDRLSCKLTAETGIKLDNIVVTWEFAPMVPTGGPPLAPGGVAPLPPPES